MALKTMASVLVLASAIDLQWSDCGSIDTHHATMTGIQPASLPIGETTELLAMGTLRKNATGGTFKVVARSEQLGELPVLIDNGDLCKNTKIKFPFGTGALVFHGLDCPILAGNIVVKLRVLLLDHEGTIDIALTASSNAGEELLCANIQTVDPDSVSVFQPGGRYFPMIAVATVTAAAALLAAVLGTIACVLRRRSVSRKSKHAAAQDTATTFSALRNPATPEAEHVVSGEKITNVDDIEIASVSTTLPPDSETLSELNGVCG